MTISQRAIPNQARWDSGANCNAVGDKRKFLFMRKRDIKVEASGTQTFTARGEGIVCIRFEGSAQIYPIRCLYTPDDNVDTISPGNLKKYLQLKKCTHEIREWIYLLDKSGIDTTIVPEVRPDDLEYIRYEAIVPSNSEFRALSGEEKRSYRINMATELESRGKDRTLVASGRHVPSQSLRDKDMALGAGPWDQTDLFPSGPASSKPDEEEEKKEEECTIEGCKGGLCIGSDLFLRHLRPEPTIQSQIELEDEGQQSKKKKSSRKKVRTDPVPSNPMYIHLRCHHANHRAVTAMYKSGHYKNLPKPKKLDHRCWICVMGKGTKVPRGPLVSDEWLLPGALFHLDFWFPGVTSIRKNEACLTIIDGKTRTLCQFPVKSRRPPLRIITYFIDLVRQLKLPFVSVRIDEDGALAQSADFCRLMAEKSVIMQTTAGYNSTNNGKAERPHYSMQNYMRTTLIGAGLPDFLWCFQVQYGAFIANRLWHSAINSVPLIEWNKACGKTDTVIDINAMPIFGARLYDMASPKKKKLDPRSAIDPRDFQDMKPSQDPPPNTAYFIGYGNNERVIKAWTPGKRGMGTIKTLTHAVIDEVGVRLHPSEIPSMNQHMMQAFPTGLHDPSQQELPDVRIIQSSLVVTTRPPQPDDMVTYTITLPPQGITLQLEIFDDLDGTGIKVSIPRGAGVGTAFLFPFRSRKIGANSSSSRLFSLLS